MELIEARLLLFLQNSLYLTVATGAAFVLLPGAWFLHLMAGILAIYGAVTTCALFLLHVLAKLYVLTQRDEDW